MEVSATNKHLKHFYNLVPNQPQMELERAPYRVVGVVYGGASTQMKERCSREKGM
eukprot:c12745_g1_i1 orf=381-545(+)